VYLGGPYAFFNKVFLLIKKKKSSYTYFTPVMDNSCIPSKSELPAAPLPKDHANAPQSEQKAPKHMCTTHIAEITVI
jgi:hypothetical protein